MDLRVVGLESAKCIRLPQDKDKWKDIVNTVMNLRTAPSAENYLITSI